MEALAGVGKGSAASGSSSGGRLAIQVRTETRTRMTHPFAAQNDPPTTRAHTSGVHLDISDHRGVVLFAELSACCTVARAPHAPQEG